MFDTKIAIILRDDLMSWQKLNVTAFLMSGIVAQSPEIIGEAYRDANEYVYNPMSIQPIVVFATEQEMLRTIHKRTLERQLTVSAYIEEMFTTNHDSANRTVFSKFNSDNANLVGVALRAEKKIVDKVTKGAKMHP